MKFTFIEITALKEPDHSKKYFVEKDLYIFFLKYFIEQFLEFFRKGFKIKDKGEKRIYIYIMEQGRKRPLDTPKRMIERREREGVREKER